MCGIIHETWNFRDDWTGDIQSYFPTLGLEMIPLTQRLKSSLFMGILTFDDNCQQHIDEKSVDSDSVDEEHDCSCLTGLLKKYQFKVIVRYGHQCWKRTIFINDGFVQNLLWTMNKQVRSFKISQKNVHFLKLMVNDRFHFMDQSDRWWTIFFFYWTNL